MNRNMECLDLEGTLAPELWVELARATGIKELERTTRDEPDFGKLMRYRMDILQHNKLTMDEIQSVLRQVEPMDGAKEFLDEVRSLSQTIFVSDTFEQFAKPVMEKLGMPIIFCNRFKVDDQGYISDYRIRCTPSKPVTVMALRACGFETIAAGDSYNDLGMIRLSKAGWLFRSTEAIKAENPDIPALETYEDLLAGIKDAL